MRFAIQPMTEGDGEPRYEPTREGAELIVQLAETWCQLPTEEKAEIEQYVVAHGIFSPGTEFDLRDQFLNQCILEFARRKGWLSGAVDEFDL